MKKLLLLVLSCFALNVYAQETVTLIVSSDGKSKNEAIKNALRSAIEQTYGTFVSTNTTILNDDLVKDEIATIASGNVESYNVISSASLPNGNTTVSLEATISYGKLITYAKSKGAECDLSTSTYLMNMKLKKLNELNGRLAVSDLFPQLREISKYMYNYEIDSEIVNVDENQETATIDLRISILVNENAKMFVDYLRSSLKAIGEKLGSSYISNSNKITYTDDRNMINTTTLEFFDASDGGMGLSPVYIHGYGETDQWYGMYDSYWHIPGNSKAPIESFSVPLSVYQLKMLDVIFDDALYNFEVYDNLGNKYYSQIMERIDLTDCYVKRFTYPNSRQKELGVSEEWNWLERYEYATRLKSFGASIPYEFSVTNNRITIPRVLYDKNYNNKSANKTFKPTKIGERIVRLTLPLETFANITNFRIEACGNQYQSILERLCNIKVIDEQRNVVYVDLGLPSGTKWAAVNAFNAPIKEALNSYHTRIPTKEQFEELINNCKFEIDSLNAYEQDIVRVIGPNGKCIKIKLSGIRDKSKTIDPSTEGKSTIFWVRTANTENGKYYAFKLVKDVKTKQLKPIKCQLEDPSLWYDIRLVK